MTNSFSIVPNYQGAFLIFCLSLITLPINIYFLGVVRLSDIFIIITVTAIASTNPYFKKIPVLIFSAFYIVLLTSDFLPSSIHEVRYEGVVFYYKYSLLFIIPYIVSQVIINKNRILLLVKILFFVYLVLVIWVYIYYVLRKNNLIISGNYRVSYPLSDYTISDAHVYSSYLSFTFVAYFEYFRKILNHKAIISSLVFVFSLIALILTGSKTGILITLIYLLVQILQLSKYIKKSTLKYVLVISIVFSTIIFFIPKKLLEDEVIQLLYNRATTVHLDSGSISNRLVYFLNAFNEIGERYWLIGNGPTGALQKWYDGGISIVLAHSGLLGLCFLLLYIYLVFIKSRNYSSYLNNFELHRVFTFLLLIYLLLSVITEHYLITRNFLPAATTLSVIYANIKQNYIESYMNSQNLDSSRNK